MRAPRPPRGTIACTLGARDLGRRRERWHALVRRAATERLEEVDGIRVHFVDDPDVRRELDALVASENECCSWASWAVAREGESLVLTVASRGHGVRVLHGLFTEVAV